MRKTVFKSLSQYFKIHGDRIFIISLLMLVMIIAFAFKKPNQRLSNGGNNFSGVVYTK